MASGESQFFAPLGPDLWPVLFSGEPSRLMQHLHDPTGRPDYRPDSWTNVYTVKLSIQPVLTIVEWTYT